MAKLAIDLVLNKVQAMTGLRSFESSVMGLGRSLLGFVGLGSGITGITATISNLVRQASRLQDLSDTFNLSAESLQKIENVARTTGVGIEEMGSKLGKLAKQAQTAAADPTGDLAETFAKIGVSGRELTTLPIDELFDRLRLAIESGKLAGQEFAVVSELLGRDFEHLLPILRMSSEEFYNLRDSVKVMSDDVVATLDTTGQAFQSLLANIKTFSSEGIAAVLEFAAVIKENPGLLLPQDMFSGSGGTMGGFDELREKLVERRRDAINKIRSEREARQKAGLIDADEISGGSESKRKKAMEDLQRAEERYADAVRDRETKTLDSTQQIGRAEAELVNLQTEAAALAENTADKFAKLEEIERKRIEIMDLQKDRQEDMLRLVEEETRAAERLNDIKRDVEDLEAERAGPKAEKELQIRRAEESAQRARDEGTAENILAAQQEAARLQRMREQELRSAGFDDRSAQSRARAFTDQVTGPIPGSEALAKTIADMARATEMKRSQTQSVQLSGQVPQLDEVLSKLGTLIDKAGSFGE